MKNSFDRVAGFYDRLARLAFGKIWDKIQKSPLPFLQNKKNILIVGGGTGQILEYLGQGQEIVFVELSKKMLDLAKRRKTSAAVDFVHQNYLTWQSDQKFDVILFSFFLDAFSESSLNSILKKCQSELSRQGELIVVDFERAAPLQNFVTKIMLLFFRIATKLESRQLLDFKKIIASVGFEMIEAKAFLKGWVYLRVFRN